MLALSRRWYLTVIMIVALGPLAGCPSNTIEDDVSDDALPDFSTTDVSDDALPDVPATDVSDDDLPDLPGTDVSDDALSDVPATDVSDDALPDFSATDANPDSPRYQEAVSPRDYLGQVSAWYFGHST